MLVMLLIFWTILLSPFLIAGIVLLTRKYVRVCVAVLAIYGVLFGSFIIHAQLEKRSTSGHIFRWLKGEYGVLQNFNDFAEDARKVVNPVELQKWAIVTLNETQQTNDVIEIPADKVPDDIRNLTSDDVPFEDASCEALSASERCIFLYWGGPFGHWGLCIGSPTFKFTPTPTYNNFIEWQPGVYFFGETRP